MGDRGKKTIQETHVTDVLDVGKRESVGARGRLG